jgi:uncharacterized protein YoxC
MKLTTALATADTIAGIATLVLVIAIVVALIFVVKYAYGLYQSMYGTGTTVTLTPEELTAKAKMLETDVTSKAETVQKNFLELLMTKATSGGTQ